MKALRWATAFSAALVILAVIAVGTTLAFVIAKTKPIENTFTPPDVDVELSMAGDVTNVKDNLVINDGDVPVYARVAVVATWVKTENGVEQTYSTAPEVEITLNGGWEQGTDGFYYLTAPLAAGDNSAPIASVGAPTNTAPEGYTLKVQVLASVIQSTPENAVEEAWGVTVENGIIIIKTN